MKAKTWSFTRRNPAGALLAVIVALTMTAALVYELRTFIIGGCAVWGAIDIGRRIHRSNRKTGREVSA